MSKHAGRKGVMLGCSTALSIVLTASSALSFTQEPIIVIPQAQQVPQQAQPAQPGTPQQQFSDPALSPGKPGTELSIPGIGAVGVLPKLDFGLELLYGPQGSSDAVSPAEQQKGNEETDVQIKGTLRHRF